MVLFTQQMPNERFRNIDFVEYRATMSFEISIANEILSIVAGFNVAEYDMVCPEWLQKEMHCSLSLLRHTPRSVVIRTIVWGYQQRRDRSTWTYSDDLWIIS
jgi:ABC-type arginine transport system permease subunit